MNAVNTKSLHIENPSPALLEFARKLQKRSEEKKAELLKKKDIYFPKEK